MGRYREGRKFIVKLLEESHHLRLTLTLTVTLTLTLTLTLTRWSACST